MFLKRLILGLMLVILGITTPLYATVDDTYAPVQLEGDGILTDFDFSFKVFSTSDVVVYLVDEATDIGTLQEEGVDYNITLNTSTDGGTVVFVTEPTTGQEVYIARDVAPTQTADIPSGGLFREQQIENALDRSMLIIQQFDEQLGRAMLSNPFTTTSTTVTFPAAEADKIIGWDSDGNNLENKTGLDEAIAATAADVVSTNADVVLTHADVVLTHADVVLTHADVGLTNADVVSTNANVDLTNDAIASVNLPVISAGDAGKHLLVNSGETGYYLDAYYSGGSFTITGGTADSLTIGGSTPADADFVLATASTINLVNSITEFSTDDTLAGDSDSAIPTEQAVKAYVDNEISGKMTAVVITADDASWDVPAGVSKVYVTLVGAGGGGAGGKDNTSGGGGGGSGAYVSWNPYTVTPGGTVAIDIGVGGTAGAANSNGGTGAVTTFGTLSAAGGLGGTSNGGAGGAAGAGTTGVGGASGSGSGGTGGSFVGIQHDGLIGGAGFADTTGGGGGGAPSIFADGGNGGDSGTDNAVAALANTGAGGGGGGTQAGTSKPGKAGGSGICIIMY